VAVVGLAGLLLGTSLIVALANPSLAIQALGTLVSLLVMMLGAWHMAVRAANAMNANLWLSVPMMVTLVGGALLAWGRLSRLFGSLVVEA
jgi:hypothetical protein